MAFSIDPKIQIAVNGGALTIGAILAFIGTHDLPSTIDAGEAHAIQSWCMFIDGLGAAALTALNTAFGLFSSNKAGPLVSAPLQPPK